MLTRRQFLKYTAASGASLFLPQVHFSDVGAAPVSRLNAAQFTKFVNPLISKIPKLTPWPNNYSYLGKRFDYYEIYMGGGRWQFSKELPVTAPAGLSTTWGYGSNFGPNKNVFLGYLGPTIEARQGEPVIVKFINKLPTVHPVEAAIDPTVPDGSMSPDYANLAAGRAVPHLHGGFTAPQFDGHPYSWFSPGGQRGSRYASFFKVKPNEAIFVYSNLQPAANLWYHDHAMGITRLNAYAGLAALYNIRDRRDTGLTNNSLGLPAGDFEIPLVVQDKSFNDDGSLFYPTEGITDVHPKWVPEFFGDTAVINAQIFPYAELEPRRYRLRFVNGSQARFYNMWLEGPVSIPLWVIGMEQSLLPAPVQLSKLLLAPGERADVIIDLTNVPLGTSLILRNDAQAPYPGPGDAPEIPELMRIDVVKPLSSRDISRPPASIVLQPIAPLTPTAGAPQRQIILKETMVNDSPTEVRLNQRYFFEPVEEKPIVGQTEIWQFVNLTGDAHPMHLHLVKFQVVNRQSFNVDKFETDYLAWVNSGRAGAQPNVTQYLLGSPSPADPEERGWKDTVKAYPGQVTRIIATFDLPPGTVLPADYVYHCHILEHEENEMMRPFQVVAKPKAKDDGSKDGPTAPQFTPPTTTP